MNTDRTPAGPMRSRQTFDGREVEIFRCGRGRPLLLLHGLHDIEPSAPFVEHLARLGQVIAPTHPGFGGTARPAAFTTIYDLVHHYAAVVDALDESPVVVGFSFGGWIAAEMAVARQRIAGLVLVDPLGVRFAEREERDIAHLFNTDPADLLARGWSDPAARPRGMVGVGWQTMVEDLPDAELLRLNRSNEALCLYGWRPHMHNPKLRHWLHRISVPTSVLWGDDDRIVLPAFGARYAALIPEARFETIAGAGHHPELEQPAAFATAVETFLARVDRRTVA